jgi:hypothetical protein
MLKFVNHGDNKHQIEDASGAKIGWISGLSVGFRGFATESDAREGAVAAWRALNRVLRQRCPGAARHEPALDRIRTVHDGAYEWFSDGTAPIARLLRPQRRAYDGSFGVEFVLPSSAGQAVAITAARSIASATAPYREEFTSLPGPDIQIGTNPSLGRFDGASTRNVSEGK